MENQRVRLSKAMLKQGLLKLLKKKSLSEITVYELCATAQINRTTFYKYYGSQAELLNEIESDFIHQLDTELASVAEQSALNQRAILPVLRHLYEQRDLFCTLVRSVPTQSFAAHLFFLPSLDILFHNIIDTENDPAIQAKYVRQFVFQGTFSVLYSWLSSETPEPAEEIADVLFVLREKLWREGVKRSDVFQLAN